MTTSLRPLLVGLLLLTLATALTPAGATAARPSRSGPAAQAAARAPSAAARPTARRARLPKARHVFVINIENKGFARTWGPDSQAPYLASTLRSKGVLLTQYYGTAHVSQGNYIAQVSGQGPNVETQSDCQVFTELVSVETVAPGQAVGAGCVYPGRVRTIGNQLTRRHLRWKGYMQDMDTDCQHPQLNRVDGSQSATVGHQYAARHNPFIYFHSIIDRPAYCARHVVKLNRLRADLRRARTTPNLAYITPDLCEDGHDAPCVDGRPGGLASVNAFMRRWVPRILRSPAFRKDGVLIITADESDGPQSDATACCGETAVNTPAAGITGPGGGRIGALVISRWTKPGSVSTTPYNHYSLLKSMEMVFGLSYLGYAGSRGLRAFGTDVYHRPR